jgi:GNAT superfamily N-acetyltransferase
VITKKAENKHIQNLTKIYDQYRIFYGHNTDLKNTQSHIENLLNFPDYSVFLAPKDDNFIGFAVGYYEFSGIALKLTCILKNIFVDVDARGKGVAGKLLFNCQADALSRGANRLRTRTARSNHSAQGVFERFGFFQDNVFVTYDKNLTQCAD